MALRITSASDVQVIAAHFGVTIEEAKVLLRAYRADELLGGVPVKTTGASAAPSQANVVGTTVDELSTALGLMEESIPVGGKLQVQLCTDRMPADEDLSDFYIKMVAGGMNPSYPVAQVIEGVPTTTFILEKGAPVPQQYPLATGQFVEIAAILPTLFIVGLIAFGIANISTISSALMPILITVVIGAIAVAVIITRSSKKSPAQLLLPRNLSRRDLFMSQCMIKKDQEITAKGWTGGYAAAARKSAMSECAAEYNRMYGIEPGKIRERYLPSTIPMDAYPQTELRDKVREIWIKATEWEHIPPDSKFVVFSEENPYNKEYAEAVGKLMRAMQVQQGEYSAETVATPHYSLSPDALFEYLPATSRRDWQEKYKKQREEEEQQIKQAGKGVSVDGYLVLNPSAAGEFIGMELDTVPEALEQLKLTWVADGEVKVHPSIAGADHSHAVHWSDPQETHTWPFAQKDRMEFEEGIRKWLREMRGSHTRQIWPATMTGDLPSLLRIVSEHPGRDKTEEKLRQQFGDAVFRMAAGNDFITGQPGQSANKRQMSITTKGQDYLAGMAKGKKYAILTTGTQAGSLVEVSSWKREEADYLKRGITPPSVMYLPDAEAGEPRYDIDFAQRLQGELTKEFRNPTVRQEVAKGLQSSVMEEQFAQKVYKEREGMARSLGDEKTAKLYEHIGGEERHHEEEEAKRLSEVTAGMSFIPDSAEYLSQTIDDTGWRDKIDAAFQAAIERTRK